MMKRFAKLIAVVLIVALLFTGCNVVAFRQWIQAMGQMLMGQQYIPFDQMEYTRPDMKEFRSQLDACLHGAQEETNAAKLMDKVYEFYDTYTLFYTNYQLANIHYYKDLTDTYWAEEYTYCLENVSEVDAGWSQLLYALADSPLKSELEAESYFGEGYFSAYSGESLWDETFTELINQEMKLQNQYDELCAQALDFSHSSEAFYDGVGLQMEQLLIELVLLRQDIAQYAGYDDYLQFAYEFYYERDYTPAQAMAYVADVQEELVELYLNIPSDAWAPRYEQWSESETFAYVKNTASAMGGVIESAFTLLEDGGYYDIAYSENKYGASFETYLQYYYVPFVFLSPLGTGADPQTFVHEFGHFCNDYASTGRLCGVDVAEVFSQGMEYLSLFYGDEGEKMEKMMLAGSLTTFVEQAAYASFEHQLYLLDEAELTVDNVRDLYEKTGNAYGFDHWGIDSREYVTLKHFYIAPMYIISYVVSNDAAMQIYQAEDAASGAGLALLEDNLDTEEKTFLAFAKTAGLDDPFEKGRVAQLRKTFEKVLG